VHIVDGILSPPVLLVGSGLTLLGVAKGLRALDAEQTPKAALLCALLFVASLVHVPVGPSSAHLMLLGLAGLLLGWVVFPVLLIVLTLQALLFGFGGITSLGVNTLNMAVPALLAARLCGGDALCATTPRGAVVRGALAGGGAILLAACLVALSLGLSGGEFWLAGQLAVVANLPVILLEGALTAAAVLLLHRVQPSALVLRLH